MDTTVKTRPTHYEVLGLTPNASSDAIAAAFTREMGRPRALSGLAEISIAFETLRNAGRRRAYDEALGLTAPSPSPEVEPFRSSTAWHAQAQFIPTPGPRAATPTEALIDPEPKPQPVLPPTFAKALRDLAEPGTLSRPAPPQAARREPPTHLTIADDPGEADDAVARWKKLGLAGGALVLVVASGGAWAGWQSRSDAAARPDVHAALPPTTFTVVDPARANAPDPVLDVAPTAAPKRAAQPTRATAPVRRASPAPSRLAEIEQQLTVPTVASADPPAAVTDPTQAPAQLVAASMPLPKAVIARTISRIGYPCGAVASTSQILGGVYTVTCTSGHVYRAAPVRGRYHFRQVKG